MSLEISIALRAEQDMTLQYRWYLENADLEVAERNLTAVHDTILQIAELPDLGVRRRFLAPELAHIRSVHVKKPFDRHLLFYLAENSIRIERVIHGARNLPNRLLEDPQGRQATLSSSAPGPFFFPSALSPQPSGLRSQVSALRSQVSGLRSQVSGLRSQVSGLRSQVSGLSFQVSAFLTPPMPRPPLTPAQKLATASSLYWSARDLKTRALRRLHPDWNETRISCEVRRIFLLSSGLNR